MICYYGDVFVLKCGFHSYSLVAEKSGLVMKLHGFNHKISVSVIMQCCAVDMGSLVATGDTDRSHDVM